ncbi:PEGA domain-containing protein [Candidatus Curtissbacteria bacterium]|nr:PEGA domain-containing protein [Candidatus Curtissbacteria bacterium]
MNLLKRVSTVKRQLSNVKPAMVTIHFALTTILLSGCSLLGSQNPSALQVKSTPEAAVFLDDKHIGKTPFYSDQLKAGTHSLKIVASDSSYSEEIGLIPGTLTVVNRELSSNFMAASGETLWLEPSSRGIFINSNPNEASVEVDGQKKGKTPYLSEEIEVGDHKIHISREGYITREFTVKTSGGSRLTADVTLASELAKNPKAVPSPLPTVQLEILKTPQGFLKVRKEASLSAPEVGRVNSGQKYELIQETKDWYKINFDGKQGWISAQYAKKI